ncbi:MAG: ATP-binding cassette domain-containing protein [Erysipelotrichaceae bacterium]|nr:ATP-binding cassette domain-containing protein [Erysipelotrichaceae bacterium]
MADPRFVTCAWQIMDELSKSNQLESSLETCIETLARTVGCSSGSIWMRNTVDNRFYIVASKNSSDLTGISTGEDESFIGRIVKEGKSLIIDDCSKYPEIIEDKFFSSLFGNNAILVPLKTPFSTVGCLQLNDRKGNFTEEDRELLENCGALIALDIEDKGLSFSPNKGRKPLLSLRGIIKEFMSGEEMRRILKGIDLDIYEGELLVVLGESGCGKSTMLNIIGGMDQASEGRLIVEGKDFSNPTESELTQYRRDYIGFIFQSYNLMPNLNALENVEFIAEISKNPRDPMECLDLVGLQDRWDRYPSAMSGGQQQRVCIARVISKEPRIILADEPTAALDFETGQGVLKAIENIVRNDRKTVIMVTHNVEIAKMADRVIRLKDGLISSVRINFSPLHAEDLSW